MSSPPFFQHYPKKGTKKTPHQRVVVFGCHENRGLQVIKTPETTKALPLFRCYGSLAAPAESSILARIVMRLQRTHDTGIFRNSSGMSGKVSIGRFILLGQLLLVV